MKFATWFLVSYVLIFLVLCACKEVEAQELCNRIEDIDGNCDFQGEKGCLKFMTNKYKKERHVSCKCTNLYMLHKTKRFCDCKHRCSK
ncbi:Plant self-incompatibility response [Arabidopsis suecica]|uniref:Plant self-incompatibility response n=1 Tax=Arabidopsis suecica TaxID=45249 RepID=A0A8T1YGN9_ARASU|nr:Plant self-incompatibility response [Arabidopsis suecica]